jgi:peptidoglycan/xylan/chitin deacetylase (PgdA/CDA1 family)
VFRDQLAMLARFDLVPVTVAEGVAHLARGGPGPRVALSFDDGYADNVTRALPLLAGVGARATFYLAAGLIERREAPWWDAVADGFARTAAPRLAWPGARGTEHHDLRGRGARAAALARVIPGFRLPPAARAQRIAALREALGVTGPAPCELMEWADAARLRDAGMEIGAHTLVHPHLTTLDPAGQSAEIAGSVELIERRLGVRPTGLAYPGGDYDSGTLALMAGTGLAYAVTTRAGTNQPGTPRFELLRRGLSDGACLDPGGRYATRLAMAEIEGAFDGLRAARAGAVT